MDQNHLNNFERGPTKDHSCEVWSNSNQWFRRRCCLKIVDGRTGGRRRRMVSDHNSSPWAFGSGELTRVHNAFILINASSIGREGRGWNVQDPSGNFWISDYKFKPLDGNIDSLETIRLLWEYPCHSPAPPPPTSPLVGKHWQLNVKLNMYLMITPILLNS